MSFICAINLAPATLLRRHIDFIYTIDSLASTMTPDMESLPEVLSFEICNGSRSYLCEASLEFEARRSLPTTQGHRPTL